MISGSYNLTLLRWLLIVTLIGFLVYLLWDTGILHGMLSSDRTWICAAIGIIFTITSMHCAYRSYYISKEQNILIQIKTLLKKNENDLLKAKYGSQSAVANYLIQAGTRQSDQDNLQAEVLTETLRGQHQVGWFITGLVIKLGLLGTVIGFGIMLSSVGSLESLEISNMENLMQKMTLGMGIALNTTMFGLVCSIFLGIQYLFLDRAADGVALQTIKLAQDMKPSQTLALQG